MKARVMLIRYVKNMKVVKALTLVSLINKVSQFFLKSNKQDGVINESPAGNYMFKVNSRNTRTCCEICSKLIAISVVLVSSTLTLNIFHTLF